MTDIVEDDDGAVGNPLFAQAVEVEPEQILGHGLKAPVQGRIEPRLAPVVQVQIPAEMRRRSWAKPASPSGISSSRASR